MPLTLHHSHLYTSSVLWRETNYKNKLVEYYIIASSHIYSLFANDTNITYTKTSIQTNIASNTIVHVKIRGIIKIYSSQTITLAKVKNMLHLGTALPLTSNKHLEI